MRIPRIGVNLNRRHTISTLRRLFCLTIVAWFALAPLTMAAEPPTPEPVADLYAQRAEAERSKMYEAGLAYSRWLDRIAQESGRPFLQERVFDRVTWMRPFACAASLAVLGGLTGWFLWFVRRRAGAIESNARQSWPALAAAAVRKPLALIVWVIGGFLAFMPIVSGIALRAAFADG